MGFTRDKATNVLTTTISKTHYVGLSTTAPTDTGAQFSEPGAATGYARAQIGDLSTAKEAQVANDSIIFFPETLANWGQITHFGLFSSASGDKPYFTGALTTPVNITGVTADNTYIPIFRAHALIIGLDKTTLETDY